MLEVDMRMFPIIAEQKTEHSWMLPILEAAKNWDWDEDEKAEDLLGDWIQEVSQKLYPQNPLVERMVRNVIILYLENEAISKTVEKHPEWYMYLPELLTAREAANWSEFEVREAQEEDEIAAADVLQRMKDGSLQPSKELISQIVHLSD